MAISIGDSPAPAALAPPGTQRFLAANGIDFASIDVELEPSPIRPGWILAGQPVARNKFLFVSPDRQMRTLIWECTAGRFNWFYDEDETVFILEGSVTIKKPDGSVHHLKAGDAAFFHGGSCAEWTIKHYVRKLAHLRMVPTRDIHFAWRVSRAVRRRLGRRTEPAMFGSS
jgi:uncharacterized cupin superfamily protein